MSADRPVSRVTARKLSGFWAFSALVALVCTGWLLSIPTERYAGMPFGLSPIRLSLVLAFSLLASLWTLAALGLQTWLGSLPAALGVLGGGSAALLAAALWQARRVLRWASFPESRRRAGEGLRALRRGGGTDAR